MPELAPKRQLTSTAYSTPLVIPITDLGLSRYAIQDLRILLAADWDNFLVFKKPSRSDSEAGELTKKCQRGGNI